MRPLWVPPPEGKGGNSTSVSYGTHYKTGRVVRRHIVHRSSYQLLQEKITFFQLEQRAIKWDNGPSTIGEPSVIKCYTLAISFFLCQANRIPQPLLQRHMSRWKVSAQFFLGLTSSARSVPVLLLLEQPQRTLDHHNHHTNTLHHISHKCTRVGSGEQPGLVWGQATRRSMTKILAPLGLSPPTPRDSYPEYQH